MSESYKTERQWSIRADVRLRRSIPSRRHAERVAEMFSLSDKWDERMYENFELKIAPGQIVAIVGPSGSGKSVLLRHVERRAPGAIRLDTVGLSASAAAAVSCLPGGELGDKLELLCRCGLGEAKALVTPARLLSAGQLYRLALAAALHEARRRQGASLILADNFADCLDEATGEIFARGIRKIVTGSRVALIAATPRSGLIRHLAPDRLLVKPLDAPARFARRPTRSPRAQRAPRWRITPGTIRDYGALGRFHYLGGPPAAHKRVYVICTPRRMLKSSAGVPKTAAILTVSPPLANVRGRNVATCGRYIRQGRSVGMRRLNAEMECISRVIVHPIFRGCSLGR